MYAGPSGISILQHIPDGSQPIAIFNSLNKSVEFFVDLDTPDFYGNIETHAIDGELSSSILNTYTKTEVSNLLTNINLTGSDNINITSSRISLTYPLKAYNEAFLKS